MTTKILFVASDPVGDLQLREDMRSVEESIRRSERRLDLRICPAARFVDLRRYLLEYRPQIVHFSSHGDERGIMLQGDERQGVAVTGEVIGRLFAEIGTVKCVLLMACATATDAEMVAEHVECVVGTRDSILDPDAREFAVAFYDALAMSEADYDKAYRVGCNALEMRGAESGLMVRYRRPEHAAGTPNSQPDSTQALHMRFPGNDFAMGELRRALGDGNATGFIGPGASADLYLTPRAFVRRLADAAQARGLVDENVYRTWVAGIPERPRQVLGSIRRVLEEPTLRDIVYRAFAPAKDAGAGSYTSCQGALLKLPLRGFVTVNWDLGLLEARNMFRPETGMSSYATWADEDFVQRWLTGEIFGEEACPILYAHGTVRRPDTILFEESDCRRAYRPDTLCRRLLERMLSQDRLVFVGLDLSDSWLRCLAEVITQTSSVGTAALRHVALVGLSGEEPYSPALRKLYQDQYNALVVFYSVIKSGDGREDHSQLPAILGELNGG